jgi:hypothetical protein
LKASRVRFAKGAPDGAVERSEENWRRGTGGGGRRKRPCAPARSTLKVLGPYLPVRRRRISDRTGSASTPILTCVRSLIDAGKLGSQVFILTLWNLRKDRRAGSLPCEVLKNYPQGEAGREFSRSTKCKRPSRLPVLKKNHAFEATGDNSALSIQLKLTAVWCQRRENFNNIFTIVKLYI